MYVEAQIASQEYSSTWENLRDTKYIWFEFKGNFEIGSFAPPKMSFSYTPLEIAKS